MARFVGSDGFHQLQVGSATEIGRGVVEAQGEDDDAGVFDSQGEVVGADDVEFGEGVAADLFAEGGDAVGGDERLRPGGRAQR